MGISVVVGASGPAAVKNISRLRARRAAGLLAAFVVIAGSAAASAADRYVEYRSEALAHRSARFAYGERHLLTYRDGRLAERVVLYTCRDGSPFARKTVEYVVPAAPNFLLEDASSGRREGVRDSQGQRVMFVRERRDEQERSTALPPVDDLVIDAGFDQFVSDHWDTLTALGRAPMRFLVPSRHDYMNFEVTRLRRESIAAVDSEVFRLRLAGVFGWLMPGIEVAYSRDTHQLVRYEGLADLRDADGDNIAVDIHFDPAARRASTVEDARATREAVLTGCGEGGGR